MPLAFWFPLLIAFLVTAVALFFYPKRSFVEGTLLKVDTLGATLTFDLRQAEGVEPINPAEALNLKTIRLCGVGWPLRAYGWFWNRELGRFLCLATNRDNLYLIRFPKRRLLVSPENSRELLLQTAR